ncbi:zinc finger BED domain-containing protein 5-like [Hydra vulgaris]|uniref:zinc finger BED domain-containing protein 5-like n=1 Tax=Hydra vulgaris TaxID=6087 RepID=UPI001F5EEC35|nr:zinc finger BED domain-containing protein 5-like [Hydra vulgaris]
MRYGFTYMLKETISYPQCVICYKVLENDSMKPSKLAIYLNKYRPDLRNKDIDFFKRKFESLKRSSEANNSISIVLEETPVYVMEDPTNSSFSSTTISPNNEKKI